MGIQTYHKLNISGLLYSKQVCSCDHIIKIAVHFVTLYSLERILGFLRIDHEPQPSDEGLPPAYWPSSGSLKVENLSARYSDGMHQCSLAYMKVLNQTGQIPRKFSKTSVSRLFLENVWESVSFSVDKSAYNQIDTASFIVGRTGAGP